MTLMRPLSYEDAIADLERRGIMPEKAPTLANVVEGLKLIGFARGFPMTSRTIVVAGTNGKGSVCSTLEAILTARGERVGLYTSPHLYEYTERIRLGGQNVSREQFTAAHAAVTGATDGRVKLSHFEVLTLMAVWLFCAGKAAAPVDRIILEVGLGGTWDATNAIPHTTSVITSLGLDHQNLLGSTLDEIAKNKLGIVRPNTLVVHAPFPTEAELIVAQTRARMGGRWVERMAFEYEAEASSDDEPKFFLKPQGLARAEIALAGRRGAENAALALTVARELGFEPAECLPALAKVRWPGRMQRIGKTNPHGAPMYASGDHNPQGIASLLELLPHYPRSRLRVLVGVGKDKNLDGVLGPLFALPEADIYLTETPFKGRAIEDYGQWRDKARGAWKNPHEAFERVQAETRPGELLLVTGSLYLVGEFAPR